MCNDSSLLGILSVVKRIILLIQVVVPIILIVFASISFMKLVKNSEEKNGIKKIINQFLAAAIIFFIPLIVNVVMGILGEKTNLSSCWNSASDEVTVSTKYEETEKEERKKIMYDADDYESGIVGMDFSCTSNIVKPQFSCATLEIVEKHLNDFDATNFKSVIQSYGGFDQYAKSVGGIFGEYYGQHMPNVTEADFQRACEYVLGWMYMYGWDYANSSGRHVKWKGNDAFYANGGFVGKYISDSGGAPEPRGIGTNFDNVISTKSQGGSVGRMASECGDLEVFVYNKLNINRGKFKVFRRLRDLKVGDCIYFYDDEPRHNAIIGEVYDDHLVIYDGGSYFQYHKNYKREVYFPTEDSKAADDATIRKTIGYSGWVVRRWYNFAKEE